MYLLGFVIIQAYIAMQQVITFEVAHVIEAEQTWMMFGTVPPYAESKLHMSQEAAWEVESLQSYVAALALHDATTPDCVYTVVAFDLATSDQSLLHHGVADWQAFQSPAQVHAHALAMQEPIGWGALAPLPDTTLGFTDAWRDVVA